MNHLILFIKEASSDPLIQFLFALTVAGLAFLVLHSIVSPFDKFKDFMTGMVETDLEE